MASMTTCKERSRPRHLFFLTFLLSMPLFFVYSQTASAAPSIPGYTLTVAATNTSFEFGTGNQWVIGTLTLPGSPLGSPTDQFDGHCFFIIDGQQTVAPSVRLDGPPWKVTFEVQLPLNLALGTHTIIAGFTSTTYSTTIYSNPITVTVTKITPGYLACDLGNFIDHQFWPAGKSHTMEPSLSITSDQQSVSDCKTGTYTLTFTGPQNSTNTDLALDSSGAITNDYNKWYQNAVLCGCSWRFRLSITNWSDNFPRGVLSIESCCPRFTWHGTGVSHLDICHRYPFRRRVLW